MKEGKVLYERTHTNAIRGNMEFSAIAPRPPPREKEIYHVERKDKFELSFANHQSLWESVPDMEDNNEFGEGEGNGIMFMRFGGGDDLTYFNFETGKQMQVRELNAKNYIVGR